MIIYDVFFRFAGFFNNWLLILKTLVTIVLFILVIIPYAVLSKNDTTVTPIEKSSWYDRLSIRGYTQFRYNQLYESNSNLQCEQCDASWGGNGGFSFRRIRLIFFGNITDHVYMYIQPDFAATGPNNTLQYAQIRDAYFDIGLNENNEFRFRIGQSKIPYGYENMQSSGNRIPLDRADALNSAVVNERAIGTFFYWAPKDVRELYSRMGNTRLKGSGDYGVVSFGVYNGQALNRREQNSSFHTVGKLTYPFQWMNQIIEPSIFAYTGKYVLIPDQLRQEVKVKSDREYQDYRVGGSLAIAPQPFGLLAEYNIGKGPEFNKETDSIETRNLHGGFVTLSYFQDFGSFSMMPYIRAQYYKGGKKHELDARSYDMHEFNIGIEWQPIESLELVTEFVISSRRYEDFARQDNLQTGSLLRLQAQINY